MEIIIAPVPLLSDNYAWVLHDGSTAAAVDPGDAGPIEQFLKDNNLTLSTILITHDHSDHCGGVTELKRFCGCAIIGPDMSGVDRPAYGGENLTVCGAEMKVIAVPGHTRTHVVYYFPSLKALFTGDTLFAAGCGRIFEGSAGEMWRSLNTCASLPDDTRIYCGHEYTEENLEFALSVEPRNDAVIQRLTEVRKLCRSGTPAVPSLLSVEKATNPFLRAADPLLRKSIGMESAAAVEVFAELRRRKDRF